MRSLNYAVCPASYALHFQSESKSELLHTCCLFVVIVIRVIAALWLVVCSRVCLLLINITVYCFNYYYYYSVDLTLVAHSDFQGALLLFRAGPHIFSAYKIVLNLSLF